ncbi:hypothetical protein Tco_0873999 [Tanacetum coccineum]|uniref:Uncharacterized protein n=1 Tax=Tanacetum coccineum TaxID=301880 RepID=A0ABQ5BL54_9ASTR
MTPRFCLRWKTTGKIFKVVGLKWVPTRKIFTSSTTKVDSEPINGSDEDITNQYDSNKHLMSVFKEFKFDEKAMTSDHNSSELGIHDHNNEPSSSKLVPKVVPLADKTATSRQELELLFHHHITILRLTVWRIPFPVKCIVVFVSFCMSTSVGNESDFSWNGIPPPPYNLQVYVSDNQQIWTRVSLSLHRIRLQ